MYANSRKGDEKQCHQVFGLLTSSPKLDPCYVRESSPAKCRERIFQMPKKRHGVEQIIPKLRQADVELGKGKKVPEI
jgi:hypothetical protein